MGCSESAIIQQNKVNGKERTFMEELVRELMQNGREDLLLAGLAVAIILLMAQLHKINKANKKIDAIVKSVEGYLSVILEEDENREAEQPQNVKCLKADSDDKKVESEEQNRLISAVLQEIFP
ncbi:MAG: hypothetical protein MR016_10880 [Agathobacter sp.]|nr:hypothetical protein [Agathobacter sp.]